MKLGIFIITFFVFITHVQNTYAQKAGWGYKLMDANGCNCDYKDNPSAGVGGFAACRCNTEKCMSFLKAKGKFAHEKFNERLPLVPEDAREYISKCGGGTDISYIYCINSAVKKGTDKAYHKNAEWIEDSCPKGDKTCKRTLYDRLEKQMRAAQRIHLDYALPVLAMQEMIGMCPVNIRPVIKPHLVRGKFRWAKKMNVQKTTYGGAPPPPPPSTRPKPKRTCFLPHEDAVKKAKYKKECDLSKACTFNKALHEKYKPKLRMCNRQYDKFCSSAETEEDRAGLPKCKTYSDDQKFCSNNPALWTDEIKECPDNLGEGEGEGGEGGGGSGNPESENPGAIPATHCAGDEATKKKYPNLELCSKIKEENRGVVCSQVEGREGVELCPPNVRSMQCAETKEQAVQAGLPLCCTRDHERHKKFKLRLCCERDKTKAKELNLPVCCAKDYADHKKRGVRLCTGNEGPVDGYRDPDGITPPKIDNAIDDCREKLAKAGEGKNIKGVPCDCDDKKPLSQKQQDDAKKMTDAIYTTDYDNETIMALDTAQFMVRSQAAAFARILSRMKGLTPQKLSDHLEGLKNSCGKTTVNGNDFHVLSSLVKSIATAAKSEIGTKVEKREQTADISQYKQNMMDAAKKIYFIDRYMGTLSKDFSVQEGTLKSVYPEFLPCATVVGAVDWVIQGVRDINAPCGSVAQSLDFNPTYLDRKEKDEIKKKVPEKDRETKFSLADNLMVGGLPGYGGGEPLVPKNFINPDVSFRNRCIAKAKAIRALMVQKAQILSRYPELIRKSMPNGDTPRKDDLEKSKPVYMHVAQMTGKSSFAQGQASMFLDKHLKVRQTRQSLGKIRNTLKKICQDPVKMGGAGLLDEQIFSKMYDCSENIDPNATADWQAVEAQRVANCEARRSAGMTPCLTRTELQVKKEHSGATVGGKVVEGVLDAVDVVGCVAMFTGVGSALSVAGKTAVQTSAKAGLQLLGRGVLNGVKAATSKYAVAMTVGGAAYGVYSSEQALEEAKYRRGLAMSGLVDLQEAEKAVQDARKAKANVVRYALLGMLLGGVTDDLGAGIKAAKMSSRAVKVSKGLELMMEKARKGPIGSRNQYKSIFAAAMREKLAKALKDVPGIQKHLEHLNFEDLAKIAKKGEIKVPDNLAMAAQVIEAQARAFDQLEDTIKSYFGDANKNLPPEQLLKKLQDMDANLEKMIAAGGIYSKKFKKLRKKLNSRLDKAISALYAQPGMPKVDIPKDFKKRIAIYNTGLQAQLALKGMERGMTPGQIARTVDDFEKLPPGVKKQIIDNETLSLQKEAQAAIDGASTLSSNSLLTTLDDLYARRRDLINLGGDTDQLAAVDRRIAKLRDEALEEMTARAPPPTKTKNPSAPIAREVQGQRPPAIAKKFRQENIDPLPDDFPNTPIASDFQKYATKPGVLYKKSRTIGEGLGFKPGQSNGDFTAAGVKVKWRPSTGRFKGYLRGKRPTAQMKETYEVALGIPPDKIKGDLDSIIRLAEGNGAYSFQVCGSAPTCATRNRFTVSFTSAEDAVAFSRLVQQKIGKHGGQPPLGYGRLPENPQVGISARPLNDSGVHTVVQSNISSALFEAHRAGRASDGSAQAVRSAKVKAFRARGLDVDTYLPTQVKRVYEEVTSVSKSDLKKVLEDHGINFKALDDIVKLRIQPDKLREYIEELKKHKGVKDQDIKSAASFAKNYGNQGLDLAVSLMKTYPGAKLNDLNTIVKNAMKKGLATEFQILIKYPSQSMSFKALLRKAKEITQKDNGFDHEVREAAERLRKGNNVDLFSGNGDMLDRTTKEAFQMKKMNTESESRFISNIDLASYQFIKENGEFAPPGYKKVVQIEFPTMDYPLMKLNRQQLLEKVREGLRKDVEIDTVYIRTPEGHIKFSNKELYPEGYKKYSSVAKPLPSQTPKSSQLHIKKQLEKMPKGTKTKRIRTALYDSADGHFPLRKDVPIGKAAHDGDVPATAKIIGFKPIGTDVYQRKLYHLKRKDGSTQAFYHPGKDNNWFSTELNGGWRERLAKSAREARDNNKVIEERMHKVYLPVRPDLIQKYLPEILADAEAGGAEGMKVAVTKAGLERADRIDVYFASQAQADTFANLMATKLGKKNIWSDPVPFSKHVDRTAVSRGVDRVIINPIGDVRHSHRSFISRMIAEAINVGNCKRNDAACIAKYLDDNGINPVTFMPKDPPPPPSKPSGKKPTAPQNGLDLVYLKTQPAPPIAKVDTSEMPLAPAKDLPPQAPVWVDVDAVQDGKTVVVQASDLPPKQDVQVFADTLKPNAPVAVKASDWNSDTLPAGAKKQGEYIFMRAKYAPEGTLVVTDAKNVGPGGTIRMESSKVPDGVKVGSTAGDLVPGTEIPKFELGLAKTDIPKPPKETPGSSAYASTVKEGKAGTIAMANPDGYTQQIAYDSQIPVPSPQLVGTSKTSATIQMGDCCPPFRAAEPFDMNVYTSSNSGLKLHDGLLESGRPLPHDHPMNPYRSGVNPVTDNPKFTGQNLDKTFKRRGDYDPLIINVGKRHGIDEVEFPILDTRIKAKLDPDELDVRVLTEKGEAQAISYIKNNYPDGTTVKLVDQGTFNFVFKVCIPGQAKCKAVKLRQLDPPTDANGLKKTMEKGATDLRGDLAMMEVAEDMVDRIRFPGQTKPIARVEGMGDKSKLAKGITEQKFIEFPQDKNLAKLQEQMGYDMGFNMDKDVARFKASIEGHSSQGPSIDKVRKVMDGCKKLSGMAASVANFCAAYMKTNNIPKNFHDRLAVLENAYREQSALAQRVQRRTTGAGKLNATPGPNGEPVGVVVGVDYLRGKNVAWDADTGQFVIFDY